MSGRARSALCETATRIQRVKHAVLESHELAGVAEDAGARDGVVGELAAAEDVLALITAVTPSRYWRCTASDSAERYLASGFRR